MEFFAYARRKTTSEVLKERLTIASLPQFCASIDKVLEDNGDTGRIYCVWGEFPVDRQTISGGVRFTLPSCPNACAWTITTGHPPDPETVAVGEAFSRAAIYHARAAFVGRTRAGGLPAPTRPG